MSENRYETDLQRARDRAMHVLLKEEVGAQRAPDLRQTLAEREAASGPASPLAKRTRWLMAAVLLLGAGVVTLLATQGGDPPEVEEPHSGLEEPVDVGDGKLQDPERPPLQVESVEQLRELFLQARGFRVTVRQDRGLTFEPGSIYYVDPFVASPDLQVEIQSRLPSFRLLARRALAPREPDGWAVAHRIDVVVDADGSFVRCWVNPRVPLLGVQGLGDFRISAIDMEVLNACVVEAGRQVRRAAGLVFGDELAALVPMWSLFGRRGDVRLPPLKIHAARREHLTALAPLGMQHPQMPLDLDLSPSAATLERGSLADLPAHLQLRRLVLTGVFVQPGELLTLLRFTSLRSLDAQGVFLESDPSSERLTKDIFALLEGSRIEHLVLAASGIADPMLLQASGRPAADAPLRHVSLDLRGTHLGRAIQDHLVALAGGDPQQQDGRIRYRELRVAGCDKVAGSWLEEIARTSPDLELLDVRFCQLLSKTGDALARVLSRLHLRELHCADLPITPQLCAALRSNGDRLEVVEFSWGGDKVFAVEGDPYSALSRLPALRRLDLRGDMALSDDALLRFARAEKLESLDIRGCGSVSDEAIAALRTARPGLAIDAGRGH